ncbi:MAG: S1C family serine protease [Candidatus Izemoplasmataceae bacterium]
MKKILLLITLLFTLSLAACDLAFESPSPNNGLTDEQVRSMIEEILAEKEDENLLYLTQAQLEAFITSLVPTHLTEEAIADLVESYLPTDLTRAEVIDIIRDLLPENKYTSVYELEAFEQAMVQMLEDRAKAVVGIQVMRADGGGSGSGVIYKAVGNTYYVVTNHHVIENFTEIEVIYERYGMLNFIEFENITFYGSDPITDMAVISFESTEFFPTVEFGDSYALRPGQMVFAVGNPLGFQYFGSVTMGIISGPSRFLDSGAFNATVIQHDASISPGNSGGALFDINGYLIGINHMKIVDTLAANIGFAVPSNTVERIVRDLEENGRVIRPYLGVISSVYVNLCDTEYGVCIDVQEGGAAAVAGLQDGDTIVGFKHVDWDDYIPIYNFNDLREAILNSRVGDEIRLLYIRNGIEYESSVTTLNPHPDDN